MDVASSFREQVRKLPWYAATSDVLKQARSEQLVHRLWNRDSSLWTGRDEAEWLGWLEAPKAWKTQIDRWKELRKTLVEQGATHFVLVGMGGSSLCPLMWERTFAVGREGLHLRVIDSTVPGQILERLEGLRWENVVAGVSSKSGTTAETVTLYKLLRARLQGTHGADWPRRVIAITDPGTRLEAEARTQGLLYCALGDPNVGGRYSAFTPYGLLPGVLADMPIESVLEGANEALAACRAEGEDENVGLLLGAVLGTAAERGHDKLTLFSSPSLSSFPLWIEQLVAESTGKDGKGLLPVVDEPPGAPDLHLDDRLFVYLRDTKNVDPSQDEYARQLKGARKPVLTIDISGPEDLGYWMYAWEFAVAVAGAIIRVNPFDQPDVESTKQKTRAILEAFQKTGRLDLPSWSRQAGDLAVYVSERSTTLLDALRNGGLAAALETFVAEASRSAAYVAINAFLPETKGVVSELLWLRRILRDATRRAVPFGWGPRYLHSTGQLHKGGPAGGMFLFLTAQDKEDIPVPEETYSFGVLKQAQVFGDIAALEERGRTVLCVDVGPDPVAGLARLRIALEEAVGMGR